MASDVVLPKTATRTRRCEDKRRKSLKFQQSAQQNIVTVSVNSKYFMHIQSESVSLLPAADIVVLLSVKKTKQHLPRPPPVCPPPLSGLCWFNPGGQQAGLTAPRHYHVIYGELWEQRGDDHSDLTPAVLSAMHQEVKNTQTYCRLLIQTMSHVISECS